MRFYAVLAYPDRELEGFGEEVCPYLPGNLDRELEGFSDEVFAYPDRELDTYLPASLDRELEGFGDELFAYPPKHVVSRSLDRELVGESFSMMVVSWSKHLSIKEHGGISECWRFFFLYTLLGQWLNFKLFGITYLVGKIKFKLFFQGPLAEWDTVYIYIWFFRLDDSKSDHLILIFWKAQQVSLGLAASHQGPFTVKPTYHLQTVCSICNT